jgi:hypothetical protein
VIQTEFVGPVIRQDLQRIYATIGSLPASGYRVRSD